MRGSKVVRSCGFLPGSWMLDQHELLVFSANLIDEILAVLKILTIFGRFLYGRFLFIEHLADFSRRHNFHPKIDLFTFLLYLYKPNPNPKPTLTLTLLTL